MRSFIPGIMLLAAGICVSVFNPGSTSADDWGTRVEVSGTVIEHIFGSVYTDPEQKNITLNNASIRATITSLLTPDGKSVVYHDYLNGIWKVPAGGGAPEIVFDGIVLYPYKDYYFEIRMGGITFGGFSPDGNYLYFSYYKYDESLGAKLVIKEGSTPGSFGASLNQPDACSTVVRIDMKTGEMKEIAAGSLIMAVSNSGTQLCWYNLVEKAFYIGDADTGVARKISLPGFSSCFTSDDRALICNGSDGQLYRVPVGGGEQEKLSTYVSGDIGVKRYPCGCSPDGVWVLYRDYNPNTLVSNTVYEPGGNGKSGYTKEACRLCLFNLNTRKTVEVFPYVPSIDYHFAQFASDGKSICFTMQDFDKYNESYKTYIHPFDSGSFGGTQLEVNETVPAAFQLAGNHPNPFNPSTTISFSLNKAGTVGLAVYDITGRKVRDLAAGRMTPGRHEMVWDGRDGLGMAVASGVYITKLTMEGKSLSHRMLLMK